jgi:solute carrier family 12 (sodium/potassium/chloride transporter), member 2
MVTMDKKQGYSFGTFQGVYVPSLLTILGVIMYLRFGWVLGNMGLPATLVIVTVANAITFLTSLSIASLATNSPVGAGGAYFMISRSLGVEAGAAIGLPLYCAQALGIAFYISGFAESAHALFPALPLKAVAIVTLVLITVLIYVSADIALKTQYIVLTFMVGSLASFFMGSPPTLAQGHEALGAIMPVGFWVAFSVFFPAVTGMESGLGMSGDLKNPARSLTIGILGSVATGYVVYMAIPVFLNAMVPDRHELINNSMIFASVASVQWLVIAGIWGATLSSAVGSLLAAPRTLQALAGDRVIPRFIGRGHGPTNEPRLATIVSFAAGLAGILLGDLNAIAPVLSMFFLTSYGLINVSAAFEGLVGSPWWRPSFRISWIVSALGAFGCFAAMFMIDSGSTFIAVFLSGVVYFITRRRHLKANWGDARTGILMWIAQLVFYRLRGRRLDERTWRPNLLVFTGSPTARWYLVAVADAFSHGRGFMTIVSIVPPGTTAEHSLQLEKTVASFLDQKNIDSAVKVFPSPGFAEGACALMRAYGFGPIVPNTVLQGAPPAESNHDSYHQVLRTAAELGRNVVIVGEGKGRGPEDGSTRIDVWWDPRSANAGLLLALAYLLRTSSLWQRSELCVKTILESGDLREDAEQRIRETVKKMRLKAAVEVVSGGGLSHLERIQESSADADFVFLGLHAPDPDPAAYRAYFRNMLAHAEKLPPFALVMCKEDVKFEHMFSE